MVGLLESRPSLCLFAIILSAAVWANPLRPPDTSSPKQMARIKSHLAALLNYFPNDGKIKNRLFLPGAASLRPAAKECEYAPERI